MAIVGVRTELDVTVEANTDLKTGLVWYMDNGTSKGQSNELPAGSATSYLGKALNFIGNKAAERELKTAFNDNQAAP